MSEFTKIESPMTMQEYLDENFPDWYTQNKWIKESLNRTVWQYRTEGKRTFWVDGIKWNVHVSKTKKGNRVVPY